MTVRARLRSVLCLTLFIVAAGSGVGAHDFWLEPSTFAPGVDEPVRIHLRIGERFSGESLARNGALIEKFVIVGPSGERPVLGRDGVDPAGLVRLDAPGIWFVGYRSRPSAVELAPEKFGQYLREEGLEHIIQERIARKETLLPVRERFSRSVKSLLRYGGDQAVQGYDRALGMTLEFVLDGDPARASGGRVPIRLLRNGRPLPGALVVAYRKDSGDTSPGPTSQDHASESRNQNASTEASRGRTDRDGRIVLPVSSGVWLLKSVYMERASAGSGADWESVWSALTFKV